LKLIYHVSVLQKQNVPVAGDDDDDDDDEEAEDMEGIVLKTLTLMSCDCHSVC
jgi:hypothetical protein